VKEGGEVSGVAGAEPLRHDVFPGNSYEFQLPFLPVPSEPGEYLLELEMASAQFGGFPSGANEPVAIPITVPTWTTEVLLRYLDSPIVASTDTPMLSFVLDRANYRPGEHLRITYRLTGAEKPVLIDAYLALRQPNGDVALATVSGQGLIGPTGRFRSEDSIHINKGLRFSGVLNLPLTEALPLGNYTLYLFFTEAGNYQMLTKATAHFLLEP
jgi:hypothetical protein